MDPQSCRRDLGWIGTIIDLHDSIGFVLMAMDATGASCSYFIFSEVEH